MISSNKAWKNSKKARKVHVRDTEKVGASREETNLKASWAQTFKKTKYIQRPFTQRTPGKNRHKDPQSLRQNEAPGVHPDKQPGMRLRFVQGRSGTLGRGLHCGQAERTAPSPGPLSLSFPTTRPLLAPLPPSPPSLPLPPVTHKTRPPPPQIPPTFAPPLPTSQESTETAGQEAPQDGPHLPFSRSLLSPARGGQKRGRQGAGAAAAAAGLHAHASQLSRERRKKGARQGSARAAAAALSTAPLCRGLARHQRLLPSRRLLPRRSASPALLLIQPLPLTQRRRDTTGPPPPPPPPRIAAKVSLRAGEPLPRRRLPCSYERKWGTARTASAWRPREIRQESRGELEGKGLPPAHSYGILSWAGRCGPPRGGREATSNNIGPAWSGLLSAARPGRRLLRSLCGRRRPSQVEVRAPAGWHLGRGCGRRRAAGGAAGRARGAARVPTRGDEFSLRAWKGA